VISGDDHYTVSNSQQCFDHNAGSGTPCTASCMYRRNSISARLFLPGNPPGCVCCCEENTPWFDEENTPLFDEAPELGTDANLEWWPGCHTGVLPAAAPQRGPEPCVSALERGKGSAPNRTFEQNQEGSNCTGGRECIYLGALLFSDRVLACFAIMHLCEQSWKIFHCRVFCMHLLFLAAAVSFVSRRRQPPQKRCP
jgi:hypothetical protein